MRWASFNESQAGTSLGLELSFHLGSIRPDSICLFKSLITILTESKLLTALGEIVDVYNRKQGRFQEGKFDTLPISGKNIYSTIDIELQKYGEDLMQNKTGAIVAIEPNSGEILSLISFPNYNPQELSGRNRSNNFKKLLDNKNKPLFNRALSGLYPPGSIFFTLRYNDISISK